MLNKTEKEFANKAAKKYTYKHNNGVKDSINMFIDFTEADIKAFLAGANWYKQNQQRFDEMWSLEQAAKITKID